MAWERRTKSGRRYFYLSVRRGQRVTTEYYGRGIMADLAILEMSLRRERRLVQHRNRERLARLDDRTNELDIVGSLVRDAALHAGGFV